MKHEGLIKNTSAYKILQRDKEKGNLSHAYLLLSQDRTYLGEYLKTFAKTIACEDVFGYCDACRTCKAIDNNTAIDVKFYGFDKKILASDVDDLVADSFVKPYELTKKAYVLYTEGMNEASQNKLLKTLEEPPENTFILLGAHTDSLLLPTIKSRVKKLEIPLFTAGQIYGELERDFIDKERLNNAVVNCDGTIGDAERLYNDENLEVLTDLAIDLVLNLKSSKDVLFISNKILKYKDNLGEFLSVLELLFRDMLAVQTSGEKVVQNKDNVKLIKNNDFKSASIIYALDEIKEARKKLYFNGNVTMVIECLLFKILEGKYKWQKL